LEPQRTLAGPKPYKLLRRLTLAHRRGEETGAPAAISGRDANWDQGPAESLYELLIEFRPPTTPAESTPTGSGPDQQAALDQPGFTASRAPQGLMTLAAAFAGKN